MKIIFRAMLRFAEVSKSLSSPITNFHGTCAPKAHGACRKIAISLIDAVKSLAPRYVAQKPIAACHDKHLKRFDQGSAVFSAHKQMF
jgi:hypothetical protein